MDIEEINESRRESIRKTVRPIDAQEAAAIVEKWFSEAGHPWRDALAEFLRENPGELIHHAKTHEGIEILYCRGKEKGFWSLPGKGMGPMQPKGLQAMKEIVGGHPGA